MLKIFNNIVREKVEFKPLKEGIVHYYSCGPTTYDFLHIGNARAMIVGDLFHRVLKELGYEVTFVRNFTDVDDKIIKRAQEEGIDPLVHSKKYVDECLKDFASLRMLPPTHAPKVSECMKEIIQMIKDLVKNGSAYVSEDAEVLYHVPHFHEYGKLSKKKLEDLQHGKRVEVEDHKKHPSDFVLWKPAKVGEPSWESPWGKGRPGWHIECSAMAKKFLGKTIDLHHGGVDLMFPHHENEIAQSEAANGCEFCRHWAHNEFLNFGSEKMSKSLGNVITIRDFVEKYSGLVLRHIMLSVHYRARVEWAEELIAKAINEVRKIHEFYYEFKLTEPSEEKTKSENFIGELDQLKVDFTHEIENDFNSAGALGVLFKFIKRVKEEGKLQGLTREERVRVESDLRGMDKFLGLIDQDPEKVLSKLRELNQKESSVEGETIDQLIQERKVAKASKDWKRADEIRDELKSKNIELVDHPDGTTTWKVRS